MRSAAFTKNGASILAGSGRRLKVCKWDVHGGARLPSFMGFSRKQPRVFNTWVGANGNSILALGYRFKPAQRYQADAPSIPLPFVWSVARWAVHAHAQSIANDMSDAAATRPIYYLELWDAMNERALSFVPLGLERPPAIASSADGHRALVGFNDGSVLLFGL